MKILLDSSFIIAIFRKNDPLHQKAIKNRDILQNDCYISNGIISDVITILGQKTKDMKDNFTIIDESDINMYNDKVFAIFEKYNKNKFRLGFIDCSEVIIYDYCNLDYVVSFDSEFRLFEEIKLFELEWTNFNIG